MFLAFDVPDKSIPVFIFEYNIQNERPILAHFIY